MALERAHSRPTAALDQTIAAVTAAVESDGGLPAAVQEAQAQAAEQGAAEAAGAACDGKDGPAAHAAPSKQLPLFSTGSTGKDGAPTAAAALAAATPQQVARGPPPAVRVPWAKKPLLNPLGSGELGQEDPLSSPRQPPAMRSCFDAGTGSGGPPPAAAPAAAPPSDASPSASSPAAAAAPQPAGKVGGGDSGKAASGGRAASRGFSAGSGSLKSGSLPSTGSAGSGALAGRGSAAGAAGDKLSPAAAAAARQRLDLSFAAPLLEAHYKCAVTRLGALCVSGLLERQGMCAGLGLMQWAMLPLPPWQPHPQPPFRNTHPATGAGRRPLCCAPMPRWGCCTRWRAAWWRPGWCWRAPPHPALWRWQVGTGLPMPQGARLVLPHQAIIPVVYCVRAAASEQVIPSVALPAPQCQLSWSLQPCPPGCTRAGGRPTAPQHSRLCACCLCCWSQLRWPSCRRRLCRTAARLARCLPCWETAAPRRSSGCPSGVFMMHG